VPSTDTTHAPRALVTGATSGIGRATAIRLAQDGHFVFAHGRNPDRGAEVVQEILSNRGRARFVPADLATADGVDAVASEVGDVDVLVNNAGFSWFGPTADLEADLLDALFASNVRAAILLVGALAPGMAKRGSGVIINLGSMAGHIGMVGGAAYGATKAALSSLARSWAAEYSPAGVRVNAVSPGPVFSTPDRRESLQPLAETTIVKRGAEAEEIAGVIAFLASPAASYMTGADVAVDGGRTAI
jgi:NAD(P)-dependent dehydrogenase (short-subunit alcohol dehydrogenase family)